MQIMKNYWMVMFFACITAASSGCHNDMEVGDLPFEEVLVIRGVLLNRDTLRTLYVARTTQYQEKYYLKDGRTVVDDFNGWIGDAVVSVDCDGRRYPMTYRGKGNFGNDTLIVAAGKTYVMHASWNGHNAEAVTTVPRPIAVDSVTVVKRTTIQEYGTWGYYTYTLEASVSNLMNTVFVVAVIQGVPSPYVTYVEGRDMFKTEPTASPTHVKLQVTCNLSIGTGPGYTNKHTMIVQCFDDPYYFYKLSAQEQLSSQIAWNVTGDGIGMFIGATQPVNILFIP
jgi:hypothetical protein